MKKVYAGLAVLIAAGAGAALNHSRLPANPPSKTVRVEHSTPLAAPLVIPQAQPKPKPAPKVVAPKPKPQPKKVEKVKVKKVEPKKNFASEVARLKNCQTLDAIRQSGKQATSQYELQMKSVLVPWYITHCLVK